MNRIQVVLIHSNLKALGRIQRALEGTRRFKVTPFGAAAPALDFLRAHPQDVVVVNVAMPGRAGGEWVQAVQEAQPGVTIFASADDSTAAAAAVTAGAIGVLGRRYTARELIGLMEVAGYGPPATEQDAPNPPPESDDAPPEPEGESVFERLLAEEPPLPGFEESGTVTDFMAISPEDLDAILSDTDNALSLDGFPDDEAVPSDTAAQRILETASDETRFLTELPFDSYLPALRRDKQQIAASYVKEPDFLEDGNFETPPPDGKTDKGDIAEYVPPHDKGGSGAASVDDTRYATYAPPPFDDEDATPPDVTTEAPEELAAAYDDPRITQMAVSLTQASLESTADATLLTRGADLIAYEGAFSDTDITEFMGVIVDGWEGIEEQQSRIRYLTLAGSGLDYMVYSRRTHEDFVLSMVFAGKTALRDIRQQGKRIAEALRSVPEAPPAEIVPHTPPDAETEEQASPAAQTKPSRGGLRLASDQFQDMPMVTYAFVWLLRDPTATLQHATAEAINAGLRVQLIESGWRVAVLDVEEDYVYMVAGIPGDDPPTQIVRALQERAGKIAAKQEPSLQVEKLWAESYFVLSPGRELNAQEIQQYLNFCRM